MPCARGASCASTSTLRQPTRARAALDGRGVGHPTRRRIRTEAPEIHQRPDRDVVGAAAVLREAQRVRQHLAELGIDVDPLAAVVGVEAAQRRVGSIGAERLVHGVEARLHAGAQFFGGRRQTRRRSSPSRRCPWSARTAAFHASAAGVGAAGQRAGRPSDERPHQTTACSTSKRGVVASHGASSRWAPWRFSSCTETSSQ